MVSTITSLEKGPRFEFAVQMGCSMCLGGFSLQAVWLHPTVQ